MDQAITLDTGVSLIDVNKALLQQNPLLAWSEYLLSVPSFSVFFSCFQYMHHVFSVF